MVAEAESGHSKLTTQWRKFAFLQRIHNQPSAPSQSRPHPHLPASHLTPYAHTHTHTETVEDTDTAIAVATAKAFAMLAKAQFILFDLQPATGNWQRVLAASVALHSSPTE